VGAHPRPHSNAGRPLRKQSLNLASCDAADEHAYFACVMSFHRRALMLQV
jgi:hypothetical protein